MELFIQTHKVKYRVLNISKRFHLEIYLLLPIQSYRNHTTAHGQNLRALLNTYQQSRVKISPTAIENIDRRTLITCSHDSLATRKHPTTSGAAIWSARHADTVIQAATPPRPIVPSAADGGGGRHPAKYANDRCCFRMTAYYYFVSAFIRSSESRARQLAAVRLRGW